jgi:hypothetical protein
LGKKIREIARLLMPSGDFIVHALELAAATRPKKTIIEKFY